ncbi:MAG: sulfite exporter TauE/SafE family protein [Acidobacteriaceae bacterium]
MGLIEFTAAVLITSAFAGLLGSLTGLGGGVVIVPVLVLLFHIDLRYAIGASLISVIATSSGAAVSYVREGFSNVRIGMFLEVATTVGALVGSYLTTRIATPAIGIIFGVTLLYSAWSSFRVKEDGAELAPNALAEKLKLTGDYPTDHGPQAYIARNVPAGFSIMFVAGVLSGLLGIGSGAVKVLAMDRAMKLPFKVSTTTSNFMIGVTAAASAGLYVGRGYVAPGLAAPVMLGVLAGSVMGARLLVKIRVPLLRIVFAVVIVALGVEMIYSGATGRL